MFLRSVLIGSMLMLNLSISVASEQPGHHAVASAHPLATEAGMQVLEQGGNAFDAAIAVTAALAVVEPAGSGIGGGGFWLLHQAESGRQIMLDGREKAPGNAHRNMYLDASGEVIPGLSVDGPLAAGIPGVPAALHHLAQHYGTLPLRESLAPAIQYAEQGFKINEHYQRKAAFRLPVMQRYPYTAEVFLQDNQVPDDHFVLRQPDLAYTLKQIAAQGAKGFYQGEIAQRLVDGVQQAGGIWTLQDLKEYQVVEREPVRIRYQNMNVVAAALPSSGGIVMGQILNILEPYDLEGMSEVQRHHLIVEAMRRAYRDRAQYLGDRDFVEVPQPLLLSKAYAAGLRAGIHHQLATPSRLLSGIQFEPGGQDTTHFSVMDAQGNRVAATLSINYPFGSGFAVAGTGVLLNDEMDDFSSKPGEPNVYGLVGAQANAIEAGKRPLSSMTPSFLETDERVAIVGTPGGSRIISMVLLAALEFAGQGSAAQMVNRPRFHHQYLPDAIQYEPGALSQTLIERLQQNGHQFKPLQRDYGNMHAVVWNKATSQVSAASDSRGIGKAAVKPAQAEQVAP